MLTSKERLQFLRGLRQELNNVEARIVGRKTGKVYSRVFGLRTTFAIRDRLIQMVRDGEDPVEIPFASLWWDDFPSDDRKKKNLWLVLRHVFRRELEQVVAPPVAPIVHNLPAPVVRVRPPVLTQVVPTKQVAQPAIDLEVRQAELSVPPLEMTDLERMQKLVLSPEAGKVAWLSQQHLSFGGDAGNFTLFDSGVPLIFSRVVRERYVTLTLSEVPEGHWLTSLVGMSIRINPHGLEVYPKSTMQEKLRLFLQDHPAMAKEVCYEQRA